MQWLGQSGRGWRLCGDPSELQGAPSLVLWSLETPQEIGSLTVEMGLLQERWQPAPLLLLLPARHRWPREALLTLPVQGLLEDPSPASLVEAVEVLLAGGRVVRLAEAPAAVPAREEAGPVLGVGGWLLLSGLQQIDAELRLVRRLLDPSPPTALPLLLLRGRERELLCARRLLLWLWGPAQMAWSTPAAPDPEPSSGGQVRQAPVSITLRQRSAEGLWQALRERLRREVEQELRNRSGQLLALEGLHQDRRSDLLQALLEQFSQLRDLLAREAAGRAGGAEAIPVEGEGGLLERWSALQPELRRQALRRLAGTYVQLPRDGVLTPVADCLIAGSDLAGSDPELPDPEAMLGTLVQARPLLVEGRLLAPDEPQSLLYLELLLANWLIRNAERISAEVLAACAEWPELRRYLLCPELLSTRNLERLRNQLNAQQRWSSWVERPVQIYESRRPLYQVQEGAIVSVDLREPRDRELRQLGWLQQLVTLSLETRDALAPQLQAVVRGLGDLLVVLLTQVVGRAIGLVGRGIMQGMGRSGGRDRAAQ